MRFIKAAAALRALCRLGLPAEQLVPALLESLHDLVPSYRNLFDWTDENAQLVRYFVEGPIDTRLAQLYFDEFHNRLESEAMPAFAALARLPAGVRGANELGGERLYRSALYHEIWKPQGFHTRLEAVLRGAGGHLLGSLVLYRTVGDPPFNAADEARLAAVLPDIAAALQNCGRAVVDEHHLPAPAPPEAVLMTLDGNICHVSAGAQTLLMLSEGGASRDLLSRPLHELGGGVLPALLLKLRESRRAASADRAPLAVSLVQDTVAGPLQASATLLAPLQPAAAPLVQVTLRRLEPRRLAVERALRSLPLTPGQAAVCRELLHGRSRTEAAARLGVSTATVVDHVRKIYGALGVRTAMDLRALLDSRLPR